PDPRDRPRLGTRDLGAGRTVGWDAGRILRGDRVRSVREDPVGDDRHERRVPEGDRRAPAERSDHLRPLPRAEAVIRGLRRGAAGPGGGVQGVTGWRRDAAIALAMVETPVIPAARAAIRAPRDRADKTPPLFGVPSEGEVRPELRQP